MQEGLCRVVCRVGIYRLGFCRFGPVSEVQSLQFLTHRGPQTVTLYCANRPELFNHGLCDCLFIDSLVDDLGCIPVTEDSLDLGVDVKVCLMSLEGLLLTGGEFRTVHGKTIVGRWIGVVEELMVRREMLLENLVNRKLKGESASAADYIKICVLEVFPHQASYQETVVVYGSDSAANEEKVVGLFNCRQDPGLEYQRPTETVDSDLTAVGRGQRNSHLIKTF